MKTIADKQLLMGADFAGFPLKEAIKDYLEKKGWTITDIGVKAGSDPSDTELMFHRIGLRVGAMISEKKFERAMVFAAREWASILLHPSVPVCMQALSNLFQLLSVRLQETV